jgi:tight adherence protein C
MKEEGAAAMRMMRWLGRRGFLGLVALAVLVAPVYADDRNLTIDQVRATSFPSITIRFTVSSQRGAPLPVLNPEDFAVTEDGRSVGNVNAYSLFESQQRPSLAVAMAMDVSGSMNDEGKLVGAKQASKAFIAQLKGGDQVEVIGFSDKVTTVVPFTNDRTALNQGIDGLVAKGNTVLYDATDRAVSDVLRVQGTRVVIVLTDGNDTASKAQLAKALDLAKQTQVPIYSIGLGSDADDAVLARMADETAGHYFKAPKAGDLATVFKLLARDISNQYELTYFSPHAQDPGKKVGVVIRVARAGLPVVQGQVSYTMPPLVRTELVPVNPGTLQPVIDPAPPPLPAPAPPPVPPPPPPRSGFTPEQAALFAFGAVLAILGGLALRLTKDPHEKRLTTFVTGAVRRGRLITDEPSEGRLYSLLLSSLAGIASRLLPAWQTQQLRSNLVLAGNPNGWGVEEFLGVRMLVSILFAGVGYVYGFASGPGPALGGMLVMGALGFLTPALWLGGKIRARQRAIVRAMPNALDLISVTVEAGLGFDQAVSEVCQRWQNELTREFSIFLGELQMGRNRREALRGLTERTGVPDLNGFVSAVIQADELGTGIARTLTVQAEQVRIKRRQHAEKLAHEAAIKMIFPLVFLIFPAIFAVILGPAIPTILDSLSGVVK